LTKIKDQEGGFHTYPIFDDKRYWAKTYTQMNMDTTGGFTSGGNQYSVNTGEWNSAYTDWSGVFGYQTHFVLSWWFLHAGYHGQKKNSKLIYDKMSFHTHHGLQASETSRAEADVVFHDKVTHRMEPILQWPNTDDYMDVWRIETHTESRYSDSKVVAVFEPLMMDERNIDLAIWRNEEKALFGSLDVSEINLKEEYDDKIAEAKGYGWVYYLYTNW